MSDYATELLRRQLQGESDCVYACVYICTAVTSERTSFGPSSICESKLVGGSSLRLDWSRNKIPSCCRDLLFHPTPVRLTI